MTTTEIDNARPTTFEALPDHMTTTEYPNEKIRTEQPTMLNEEETAVDPAEVTTVTAGTEDTSSTEEPGTNEIDDEKTVEGGEEDKMEEKEEDYVFTTEATAEDLTTKKPSTEKPTTIEDVNVEVTTLETGPRDFSTEHAFADLLPTAPEDEIFSLAEDD